MHQGVSYCSSHRFLWARRTAAGPLDSCLPVKMSVNAIRTCDDIPKTKPPSVLLVHRARELGFGFTIGPKLGADWVKMPVRPSSFQRD